MLAFDMIVAVAENGVIGLDGDMPWHVPEDLRHFKRLTQGHPVLMGRKTWESLPRKPLPDRLNLVLTRQSGWQAEGATAVQTVDDVQRAVQAEDAEAQTCFVMGGSAVYQAYYAMARYIWLTRLDIAPDGDTWFDLPENRGFTLVQQSEPARSQSGISFVFEQWAHP